MFPINTEICTQIKGDVGFITLQRPGVLNALSLAMLNELAAVLKSWQQNDKVMAVAIRGSNKEGCFGNFCAGGDIRWLYQQTMLDNTELIAEFFTSEYRLDYYIHQYSKPIIAFMDGIVMGGGMGIAQGATLRIVTERSKLAMPETAIGLFPDAGGGYFLSRCPKAIGEWLGLTGISINAATALSVGLADALLPCELQQFLWDSLQQKQFANAKQMINWLQDYFITPAPSDIPFNQINSIFSLANARQIIMALEADQSHWAQETAKILRQRSPLLVAVALEHIHRSRQLEPVDIFRLERTMVEHSFNANTQHCEVIEGIRALLIDKDLQPKWQFDEIEQVPQYAVAEFFTDIWSDSEHPLKDIM